VGMFDNVICEHALPDGYDPTEEWFQTKDTPTQALDTYKITADGQLLYEEHDVEDRSDPNATGLARLRGMATRVNKRWVPADFHGALRFYTFDRDDADVWREYVALYDHGKLLKIECARGQ
jgi:hypothetical protein